MKKLYLLIPLVFIYFNNWAQTYVPVSVTGFNSDIIANGSGGSNRAFASTTGLFDGENPGGCNVMYTKDFRGNNNPSSAPTYGLPTNGIINSLNLSGATYNLSDYSSNNTLLLTSNGQSGTLNLQTPGVFAKIAFLGASAEGASTFTLQLNFSDGTNTSQSFTVPDWYDGSNYAIKAIGRVTRIADGGSLGADAFTGTTSNPRLYDNVITLGAPYNTKILNSIQFTKSSTAGRTAILAICGVTAVGAPAAPVATAATSIIYTGFSANWNTTATATGYYLDVSTSPTFTTNITGYNNLSVGNVLTYSVIGLTAGTIYYYRVRAINASGTSASSNTITVGNLVGKYVTSTGAGTYSGNSWANAIAGSQDRDANGIIDLQDAISNSTNTCIWVAAGTFKPTTGTDRTKSFTLKSTVQVFGGFCGTETTSSQRSLSNNSSILSGDIGTAGLMTDNSLHVISIYGTTVNNTALLDGFTISNGYNADQTTSYPNWWGAGIMQANNNLVVDISPVYRNCKIIGNHSYAQGAAICNINSWTAGCTVSPQFINCVISGNKSETGMIVYNNCYSGGTSNMSYINCTFSGNYGNNEIIYNSISSGSAIMTNCIVYTNRISSKSAYINGGTITYSDIEGGFTGSGNINSDPIFTTPINPLTAPTTSGDLHISTISPCYNSGTSSGAPSTDIEGTIRTSTTDMGAFENQNLLPIELFSFKANCINGIANLSWITVSETNNDYFTIEKSTNGKTWEFVTKIKGAGNSNSTIEYSFNDHYPFSENFYYRLKQTDFDGRFTFSDIINFRVCLQKNDVILVYPNPTRDLINVVSKNNEVLNSIEIISITGQLVYSEKVNTASTTINTSNLSIGLYYLLSTTATGVYVNKIEIKH